MKWHAGTSIHGGLITNRPQILSLITNNCQNSVKEMSILALRNAGENEKWLQIRYTIKLYIPAS